MKTKLLKKLRKEAKERIYLIPWKLSGIDKQVIVKKDYGLLSYYYGIEGDGACLRDIETTSSANIEQGYSMDDGLEKLAAIRRDYILLEIRIRRRHIKEEAEQKKYQIAAKMLKKY